MSVQSFIHLAGRSWYLPGPTNIGLIETGEGVWLVDSGNDKDAGRKLNKLLAAEGRDLKGIINTHSNADHIGANNFLQMKTGCEILASRGEAAFISTPVLEPSFLWGGYPFRELRSKFFEAKPSRVDTVIDRGTRLPFGEVVPLPGHFFDQIGLLTADGVFFLGDSMFGEHVLEKYRIPYIYDVASFKESIRRIRSMEAEKYVPCHGEVLSSIDELAQINLKVVENLERTIVEELQTRMQFEPLLQVICNRYGVQLNAGQFILISNTIRSFLAYLADSGQVRYGFADNMMFWESVPEREE